jgi:hypothetical protein
MEIEGRSHLTGIGVADLHGIAIGGRHVEPAKCFLRGAYRRRRPTAAISGLTRTRPYRIEKSVEIRFFWTSFYSIGDCGEAGKGDFLGLFWLLSP